MRHCDTLLKTRADGGEEILGELVVSSSDAAEVPEAAEYSLDGKAVLGDLRLGEAQPMSQIRWVSAVDRVFGRDKTTGGGALLTLPRILSGRN